jgi:hypothetical protein
MIVFVSRAEKLANTSWSSLRGHQPPLALE